MICFPFLDTGSDEQRQAVFEELVRRGYAPWVIGLLRRLAGLGLWYQVVAWEWGALGLFDVLLGYGVLFLAASPFPFVFFPRLSITLLSAGLLSLSLGIVGLRWRRSRAG